MQEENSARVVLSFKVKPELKKLLEEAAKEERRTVSAMAELLIEDGLAERKRRT
jgi:predicted transcriptional regulator